MGHRRQRIGYSPIEHKARFVEGNFMVGAVRQIGQRLLVDCRPLRCAVYEDVVGVGETVRKPVQPLSSGELRAKVVISGQDRILWDDLTQPVDDLRPKRVYRVLVGSDVERAGQRAIPQVAAQRDDDEG